MTDIRVPIHPDQFKKFQEWQRLREEAAKGPGVSIPAYKEPSPAIPTDKPNRGTPPDAGIPEWIRVLVAQALAEGEARAKTNAEQFARAVTGGSKSDQTTTDTTMTNFYNYVFGSDPFTTSTDDADTADTTAGNTPDKRVGHLATIGELAAMEKRVDAVLEHVNDLVGLLDRLTVTTNKIAARLTAVEAAQRQPTTVAIDGQNGPGEVREVQNDIGGESDALHRSSTYPETTESPPPVPTVNGWRLNVAPAPERGRRVDILIEYPHKDDSISKVTGEVVEEHTFSPVTWRTIIAWRYTG